MKYLICGGRDFLNAGLVREVLTHLVEKEGGGASIFITGDCPTGVDRIVKDWCEAEKFPYHGFPANWDAAAKAAGRSRNADMLFRTRPDYVIAFPGGKGTAHMTTLALTCGYSVAKVRVQWTLEHFDPAVN